jgi:arsenate reductase-like glutaredoxin family protein
MQNMKLLDLQTGKYLELGKDFYYGGDTITCPPVKSFITKGTGQCLDIYADNVDMYDINEIIDGSTDDDIKCGTSEFEITLKSNNQKFVGVPVGNIDDRFNRIFYKTEPQEPLKTLCEKTGAVVYGGRYVVIECLDTVQNGDIIRNMKHTGLCYNEKSCEFIVNINDYYTHEGFLFNKHSKQKTFFERSKFEDVLKQVRTNFEYASSFFYSSFKFETKKEQKILTPKIKEMMIKEPTKTIERFYFQHIAYSGLYIIGNIFEEYSKQLRNEPNKFEELMELIK